MLSLYTKSPESSTRGHVGWGDSRFFIRVDFIEPRRAEQPYQLVGQYCLGAATYVDEGVVGAVNAQYAFTSRRPHGDQS